jgi:hypothetical protein
MLTFITVMGGGGQGRSFIYLTVRWLGVNILAAKERGPCNSVNQKFTLLG